MEFVDSNVREGPDQTPAKWRLLDQFRDVLRAKHYSYRTEQAYVHWDAAVHLVSRQAASPGNGRCGS